MGSIGWQPRSSTNLEVSIPSSCSNSSVPPGEDDVPRSGEAQAPQAVSAILRSKCTIGWVFTLLERSAR
jgi:hypothetical protein